MRDKRWEQSLHLGGAAPRHVCEYTVSGRATCDWRQHLILCRLWRGELRPVGGGRFGEGVAALLLLCPTAGALRACGVPSEAGNE